MSPDSGNGVIDLAGHGRLLAGFSGFAAVVTGCARPISGAINARIKIATVATLFVENLFLLLTGFAKRESSENDKSNKFTMKCTERTAWDDRDRLGVWLSEVPVAVLAGF